MAIKKIFEYFKVSKSLNEPLQVGSFVKIKEGCHTEEGMLITNWAGKVVEVYSEHQRCLVALDALTLNALDDDYLLEAIEDGTDATQYVFEYNDLLPMQRRDTDKTFESAMEAIQNRIATLDTEGETDDISTEGWAEEFVESPFFNNLTDDQKASAGFTVSTFLSYMYDYEGETPSGWDSNNVKSVCLNYVPKKVTAEIDFFKNYGDVLIQFFKFLDKEQYIINAQTLQKAVTQIKNQIPIVASDPRNWGMAKSMMMGAQQSGYDINNQEELNAYMLAKNRQSLSSIGYKPAQVNPYKDIGRNDKISVKYSDGVVKVNVKFKTVEQDLMNGVCELIK